MKKIYKYLGLPYFKVDYNSIKQVTYEDDKFHGIYGDHKLRKEFKRKPDDYYDILGYENCARIKQHYQWFYDYFGYV
jgi:hypothetical protein